MADRSEVKVADEAFAYNSSITFLPIHLAESLISMNAELAKIDELLVDDGVESIYHINQEDNIDYSMEMLGELLAYSSDLAFYALELIDKPLYKNFNLNATESISRIKVEDYSTENTLGITYTTHASYGDTQNAKKTLSIEDFLGVTAPENGGNLSNIPKEFSDFSNQYVTMYENLKANLVDEDGNQITLEEYLDQLVSMGEFSHTKDQPFRQFLSAVLDITIILPLIEACTGTDYITDEDLSDFERGMKGVGAVVGAFSLGTSYVAMKGAGFATQEILMNMGKAVAIDVASTTTSYWTGYACNEMGLPLPLTLMFSMGVGMGVSYKLNGIFFNGIDAKGSVINEEFEMPDLDNMTDLERSRFWDNYFREEYGTENVTRRLYIKDLDIEDVSNEFNTRLSESYINQHARSYERYFELKEAGYSHKEINDILFNESLDIYQSNNADWFTVKDRDSVVTDINKSYIRSKEMDPELTEELYYDIKNGLVPYNPEEQFPNAYKQFSNCFDGDNAVACIISKNDYKSIISKWGNGLGRPSQDGNASALFVIPASDAEKIFYNSSSNEEIAQILGLQADKYSSNGGAILVKIDPTRINNVRYSTPDMAGSNIWWAPGMRTSGGQFEAVIDRLEPVIGSDGIIISDLK